MEVITYKCPNCGGDLTFDPVSGKYKCEYCLSSFTQEEMEKANPKDNRLYPPSRQASLYCPAGMNGG